MKVLCKKIVSFLEREWFLLVILSVIALIVMLFELL